LSVAAEPQKLSRGEWLAGAKRAGSSFLADDCMGLAQQIAYSWMLAFFPAVAFFLGLLGRAASVRPAAVVPRADLTARRHPLHRGAAEGLEGRRQRHGARAWRRRRGLGRERRDGLGDQGGQPCIRAHGDAAVLEDAPGRDRARVAFVRDDPPARGVDRVRRPLGQAIADKAGFGSAFTLLWSIARWPIAFVAVLLLFGLIYYYAPNVDHRHWKWVTPGSFVGALLWLALSGLFTLYVTFAGSYSKTYGSLAAGVILMLWLNYSAWAILFARS